MDANRQWDSEVKSWRRTCEKLTEERDAQTARGLRLAKALEELISALAGVHSTDVPYSVIDRAQAALDADG